MTSEDRMNISDLEAIYEPYHNIVTPLLVEIEVETEKFPVALLNEVRALNDHVARSLFPKCETPEIELQKASRHVVRLQLDCLKTLVVIYREKIKTLQKNLRYIDLTKVSNGEFYPRHRRRFRAGEKREREAKLEEHKGQTQKALNLYEKAYDNFARCAEELQSLDKFSLKLRFWRNQPVVGILRWILLIALGTLIGKYFDKIWPFLFGS